MFQFAGDAELFNSPGSTQFPSMWFFLDLRDMLSIGRAVRGVAVCNAGWVLSGYGSGRVCVLIYFKINLKTFRNCTISLVIINAKTFRWLKFSNFLLDSN